MTSDAAPAVTLAQPANTSAKFAAFDSVGNLYVSRGAPGTTSAVVRYKGDDLAAAAAGMAVTPVPDVTITSPDMMNPAGLAFDDLGNLWVASSGNDKVLEFTKANMHIDANFMGAADIAITAKSGGNVVSSYTEPVGLAFDKDKNLWVGYISNLVKLTVAQQGTSAELSAPFAITLATGNGFAFDESGGIWTSGPGIGSPSGQHQFQRIPAAMLAAGTATPDITIDSADLGSVETIVINPAPTWSLLHDSM